jgi:peptide/nickel transport system permease protein
MAPIVVAATLNVAKAILLESYVSYLGYGIQPPAASSGSMLNNAQIYLTSIKSTFRRVPCPRRSAV